ncbi:retrotransposon protein, putative, ty1-copia subclass [Tanacetum coccineum]|uniref:Retrotransposon protein, putative, ty1-copia subclass n=1 Tax=Tanacetum coccineum TaxID=301880 RepID=A0ABQ5BRC0_9ASTR
MSTDDESFEKCESCLSGKMTKKPFPHSNERAKDLLGIIHTDVWGCEALVKRDTPDKLKQRTGKGIYKDTQRKHWLLFYFPPENKIVVARYAEFFEKRLINQEISGNAVDLEEIQEEEDTSPSEITSNIPQEVEGFEPPQSPQEEEIPIHRVDYEEMFSPVADIRAIIILISIATYYDYEIWKMDVKTAFLNGYLDEDIYMVQPEDIIIMGNHIPSLQSVKDYLGKCFAVKDLGEAAFILGIKIYRDRSKRLIGLSQNAYMDKILKRYKMDNSKRDTIPMQERLNLNKSQGAQTPKAVNRMKNVPYTSAVGSIMYAVRCTRHDVAFAQNLTSRFQQNPESEYIVASEAAMEAVWIRKFISGLGIVPTINEPINMYCDNSTVVHYANEPGVQRGVRHYLRRYHYVCESVVLGEIKILKVHADNNLADPFTKALSNRKLTQHATSMRLVLLEVSCRSVF